MSFEELDREGKYTEILSILEGKTQFSDEEIYWKLTALSRLNKTSEAFEFSKTHEPVSPLFRCKYLNRIGVIYEQISDLSMSYNYFQLGLELAKEHDLVEGISLSNYNLSNYYITKGEFDEAKSLLAVVLEEEKKIGKKSRIAETLNSMGLVEHSIGNLDQALVHYQEALSIWEELDDINGISIGVNNIGTIYNQQGDLNKGLEYYLKYQDIANQMNDLSNIAAAHNNVGLVYAVKGDLKKAEKEFTSALDLYMELNNPAHLAMIKVNFGDLYMKQGRLRDARDQFETALALDLQHSSHVEIAETMQSIIQIDLMLDHVEEAKQMYEQLVEVVGENRDSSYPYKLLSEAMILKSSPRIRDRGRAEYVLLDLINNYDLRNDITLEGMYHLIELLLLELKINSHPDVLSEINEYIGRMYEIAQIQHMYPKLIDVLLLKSKLVTIQGKFEEAEKIVEQALILAKEKNLVMSQERCLHVKKQLIADVEEIRNLVEENASYYHRIEKMKLLDYIQKRMRNSN